MIKKFLFLSLLAVSSAAFAGGPEHRPMPTSYFDGAYVGVAGGVSQAIFKYNIIHFSGLPAGIGSDLVTRRAEQVKTNGIGSVYFGDGAALNHWFYLGSEFEVSPWGLQRKTDRLGFDAATVSQATTVLSFRNFAALTIRPGFLLTPTTLLTIPMGITLARVKFNSRSLSAVPLPPTTNDVARTELGYRVGLAVEQHITRRLTVLGAYFFTVYRTTSRTNPPPPGNPTIGGISNTTSLKMYTNRFMLGLNYYLSV